MEKKAVSVELDTIDRRIIEALRADGRKTVTDLAIEVGISKTPCQNRMRKLIESGVIRGFRAIVDPATLGLDHIAYVQIGLSMTHEKALSEFNAAVRRIAEVEECHMIAGSFDYLLKVRTLNMRRYRQVMGEKITNLPYVATTSTFVVMEAVKEVAG